MAGRPRLWCREAASNPGSLPQYPSQIYNIGPNPVPPAEVPASSLVATSSEVAANPALQVAENWQQHEQFVTQTLAAANPGVNVGEQVTLMVVNNTTGEVATIRIDNIYQAGGTTAEPIYQLADAKFSSVNDLTTANLNNTLTDNQSIVYPWIARGDSITIIPSGQNAANAGISPGWPIQLNPSVQIYVNGPNGIVVRPYSP